MKSSKLSSIVNVMQYLAFLIETGRHNSKDHGVELPCGLFIFKKNLGVSHIGSSSATRAAKVEYGIFAGYLWSD